MGSEQLTEQLDKRVCVIHPVTNWDRPIANTPILQSVTSA